MALSQDIKERIFAAADALHAASETGEFPSVEAVRQESHAGMNNVVEAMKEWRQNQRKQVQAVREPLPVELHGVVQSMGQSLWETAQQLANESLDAAKVAFETEKSDLIQLSAEQSEAFETQAAELNKAQRHIAELERQALAAKQQIEMTGTVLADTRDELRAAKQAADLANQKAEEIERRAAELRAELDHAHAEAETAAAAAKATADSLRADADRLRTERDKAQQRQELADAENAKLAASLAAAQSETMKAQAALAGLTAKAEAAEQAHQEQRKQAAAEANRAAERMTKAQAERDDATKATTEARERAAGLAGQLQAMQEQNAALLAAIKPQGETKPKKTPPAKA
jgi:DNA repair exonuclease SbcCD ATPase subunit